MSSLTRPSGLVPNTLGVACVADCLRVVESTESLSAGLEEADAAGAPATVVAGGSNLVLRARLPGVALLLRMRGLGFERLTEEQWRVTAAAGETWQDLVQATLRRGIGGLENLALIPGSVGAAPVQNIGAYGRELEDVLESVQVLDRATRRLRLMRLDECGFSYRDSVFRRNPGPIIVAVTMRLGGRPLVTDYPDVAAELRRTPGEPSPWTIAEAVTRVRQRKLPDPARVGNVGSFFKNPFIVRPHYEELRERLPLDGYPAEDAAKVKVSAARLIDAAGWKGVRRGAVEVWPRQPLVLVNRGGATGAEVLALGERIRDDVLAKYAVRLDLEPTVLGVD